MQSSISSRIDQSSVLPDTIQLQTQKLLLSEAETIPKAITQSPDAIQKFPKDVRTQGKPKRMKKSEWKAELRANAAGVNVTHVNISGSVPSSQSKQEEETRDTFPPLVSSTVANTNQTESDNYREAVIGHCQFFLKKKNRICAHPIFQTNYPLSSSDIPKTCQHHTTDEKKYRCDLCGSLLAISKYQSHINKGCPTLRTAAFENARTCFVRGTNCTLNTLTNGSALPQQASDSSLLSEKEIYDQIPGLTKDITEMSETMYKYSYHAPPLSLLPVASLKDLSDEKSSLALDYWRNLRVRVEAIWERQFAIYGHHTSPGTDGQNSEKSEKTCPIENDLHMKSGGLYDVVLSVPPQAPSLLVDFSVQVSEQQAFFELEEETSKKQNAAPWRKKHMRQHDSLLQCIQSSGLTQSCFGIESLGITNTKTTDMFNTRSASSFRAPEDMAVVELGAGKAGLLNALVQHHVCALKKSQLELETNSCSTLRNDDMTCIPRLPASYIAVDCQSFRNTLDREISHALESVSFSTPNTQKDNGLSTFSRIRHDIRDFTLDQLLLDPQNIDASASSTSSTPSTSSTAPISRPCRLVRSALVLGKHLCGGATDSSIRCVLNARAGFGYLRARAAAEAQKKRQTAEHLREHTALLSRIADFEPERRERILQRQLCFYDSEDERKQKEYVSSGDHFRDSKARERNPVDVFGLALATCCHHRCDAESYAGLYVLQEWGIDPEELQFLARWSSWWTSHEKDESEEQASEQKTLGKNDKNDNSEKSQQAIRDDDHELLAIDDINSSFVSGLYRKFVLSLNALEKGALGKKCKLLLDLARAVYLYQQSGADKPIVQIIRYISADVTRENMLFLARFPSPGF